MIKNLFLSRDSSKKARVLIKLSSKQVLSIAGSDSGGGAGVQADLKTFSALGVFGTTVVTSITSQNTKSVDSVYDLPKEEIRNQINSVLEDFKIRVIKIGMVHSKEIIEEVASSLSNRDVKIVLDPVMVAESGDLLLERDAVETFKDELLGISEVLTPNSAETQVISGIEIEDEESLLESGRRILELGPSNVVVTGGGIEGNDYLFNNDGVKKLEGEKFGVNSHGSGCTFSSAIASYLAKGFSVFEAVKKAQIFTKNSIKYSHEVGGGNRPVNQFAFCQKKESRYSVLRNIDEAIKKLPESFKRLIPEVGTNLAMATKNPENQNDVAGISGRIVSKKEEYEVVGCPRYGGSSHVARLILEANGFDENIRSAINIGYGEDRVKTFREKGFSVSSFNRDDVSKENTMSSGARKAIEEFGGVPDIIYDEGGVGKEPMIRVLGEKATQVVDKTLKLL
ncbi:bifunctional hydroxymethylpyrimidine kinase/phosphomethylpyrimidine kinase [archaeon SCG-AAA382B04]|nr:bifunctional hydroxymethylpyrimidine kinase/phosphomethylpyrimidine kinase [archaeon SCG-AAA382B04]